LDPADCTNKAGSQRSPSIKIEPPYIRRRGESFGRVFRLDTDFFEKIFFVVRDCNDLLAGDGLDSINLMSPILVATVGL
jgi:hypothetical protein